MIWLQIVYLLVLVYFAAYKTKISEKGLFRAAWITFALVPISNFVFTLFRVGNIRSPRALGLVEVWSNGFAWLLLGISFLILINALIPKEKPSVSLEKNMQNQNVGPDD